MYVCVFTLCVSCVQAAVSFAWIVVGCCYRSGVFSYDVEGVFGASVDIARGIANRAREYDKEMTVIVFKML